MYHLQTGCKVCTGKYFPEVIVQRYKMSNQRGWSVRKIEAKYFPPRTEQMMMIWTLLYGFCLLLSSCVTHFMFSDRVDLFTYLFSPMTSCFLVFRKQALLLLLIYRKTYLNLACFNLHKSTLILLGLHGKTIAWLESKSACVVLPTYRMTSSTILYLTIIRRIRSEYCGLNAKTKSTIL